MLFSSIILSIRRKILKDCFMRAIHYFTEIGPDKWEKAPVLRME
jgi:hypothetical protein